MYLKEQNEELYKKIDDLRLYAYTKNKIILKSFTIRYCIKLSIYSLYIKVVDIFCLWFIP